MAVARHNFSSSSAKGSKLHSKNLDENTTDTDEEISEEEAEMPQQGIHHEHDQSSTSKGTRKSKRSRKQTRSFSPDTVKKSLKSKLKKRKRKGGNSNSATAFNRPCDKLPNGMPFSCYLCKSPYVCNDTVRSLKKKKQSRHMPYPRCKINPQTGQEMLLCNACGLAIDRPIRQKKPKKVLSEKERDDYLTKARHFAKTLVEKFGEPAASRLYCPPITDRICGCIQKYIMVNDEICETRGQELIEMLRKALQLSKEKCYSTADTAVSSRKSRSKNVGLGSGHKRSKIYTEFVLKSRSHLKKEIGLCERGSQKILLYSNNFLHKTLKTEKNSSRLLKRKFAGILVTFSEILAKPCCVYNCVMMAATHCRLLEKWRERALTSQAEARRVMAEMLTPAGGNRVNCNLFISLVTGCSKQTIHRVKQQMQTTQGDKEPPVHGLRKYWQEVQQKQGKSDTMKASQKTSPIAATVTTTTTTTTASESTGPISDIATNAAKNAQAVASFVPANSVTEPTRHIATTNPTASDVQHQCHLMKIQQHLVEHHLQLQQILKQHLIQKNHIHNNSSPTSYADTTPTDRQPYVNSQNQPLRHMAALQRTSVQPIQGTQQILTPLNVPVQSQFAQNQPSQQIPCRQVQTSCNAQIYSTQPPLQVQIQTLQAPSTTQNQSIQAPYLTQIPQMETSHSTQIHQMSASQHPRIHPTSVQTLIPHFQAPQPSWITQLQQLQASSQTQINQVQVSSQAPIQTIHVASQNPSQTFQLLMPGPTQLQTNIPQGAQQVPVQHILDNCSQNSYKAVQTMQPNCGNQNTQLQQFINLNQQISTRNQLMSNLVYMSNQNQYPVMNTMPPNQYQSIMNMSDTNSNQSQQAYNPFSAVRNQLQQGQNQIQTLSTKLPCPANQVQPVLSGTQVSSTAANSAVITLPMQMLSSHPVSSSVMVTQGDSQHNSAIQAQGYVQSTILDHQRNTDDKLYQKSHTLPSVSQDFGSQIPIQTTSSHHVQNVRATSRKVNQAVQTVNSANPRISQSTQIQRMAQRLEKTPVPLQATKQSVRQALIQTSMQNKFAEQLHNHQASTASANNPHQHYFVEAQSTRALQQSVQESFEQPSISGMILPNTQTPNETLEQQHQRHQWQMQMQNASALIQRDGYIEHGLRGLGHVHMQNKQPCENQQQRQAAENRALLQKSKDINSHRQIEMSMSSDRHAVARPCNPAIGGHKLYATGSTAGFDFQLVGHQPMEVDSHVDDELLLQTSNSQSLAFTGHSLRELLKRTNPSISIHSHTSQLQSNLRHSSTQKENKEGRPVSFLNMSSARHSGVEMNSIPNAIGNQCPRKATFVIPNAVISKLMVDAPASANISMQTHDGSGGETAHDQNRLNPIVTKQEEPTRFDSSERQSRANDSSEESGKLKAARGSISFKMKTHRSKGLVGHTFRKVQSKDGKLLMQSEKKTSTQRQPSSGHSILQDILEAPPKFTSSQLIEATKTSKTAGQSSY